MPRKWLLLHLFIIQNKTFPSFRRLHLKQFRFFFKTMFLSLNGLKKSFNGLTLFRVLLLGTGVENLVPHIKLFFHHLFPKQRFYCCLQQMALLRFYCIFFAAAWFEPMVELVVPDWDLWRMVYWLSYCSNPKLNLTTKMTIGLMPDKPRQLCQKC